MTSTTPARSVALTSVSPPNPVSWASSPRLELARPASDTVPTPESRGRRLAVRTAACAAIAVSVLYLTWRVLASMAGATWYLAAPLLVLEVHAFLSLVLFTHDLWDVDARPDLGNIPREHQRDTSDLRVALLIPTYNEPRSILLPTIAAAVATRHPHETWVLDDGDRPWLRDLAAELGARYRCRRHGAHAKAGNLNEALDEVRADLVAVVDADHVVTDRFLQALVPYFADNRTAMVQTPQEFYNDSSFEHVRKPDGGLFQDQEMFYRAILAGRNRWQAAFWCGTGALIRVEALRSVGGVATDSVTEDIQTTLRLHRRGWHSVHHNEVLARGLAADGPEAFFIQRRRWGAGAMQVLRRDNPLTGPGLSLHQRVSFLSTLLGWFDSWRTVGLVVLPIATVISGGTPIAANWRAFLVAFGGAFIAQRVALTALSRGRAPQLHAIFFEFVRLPATLAGTMSLFTRGPAGFAVTPKGARDDRQRAGTPVILTALITLSAIGILWYLLTLEGWVPLQRPASWVEHAAAVWLVVNAAFLVAARRHITRMDFAGNRRSAWRFPTEDLQVAVSVGGEQVSATLLDLSITGARLRFRPEDARRLDEGGTVVLDLPVRDQGGDTLLPASGTVRTLTLEPDDEVVAGVLLTLNSPDQARLSLALYQTVDHR